MSRFTVGIVGYGVNDHARCFEDVARSISEALIELGHDVVPHTDAKPGRLIIFGGNNLSDPDGKMPDDTIIYNSEQLSAIVDPRAFLQNYLQYRNLTVWDYAESNIEELKKLGISRAIHCPVGYVRSMTRFASLPDDEQDIDVLHYGSIGTSRRKKILSELEESGLNVKCLFNVYGADRDAVIARSKVVLNIHYYERGIFEVFRCSHLFSNRKCVVTEAGGTDKALERLAQDACWYSDTQDLVMWCKQLCKQPTARRKQGDQGFNTFSKIRLVDNVKRALEWS